GLWIGVEKEVSMKNRAATRGHCFLLREAEAVVYHYLLKLYSLDTRGMIFSCVFNPLRDVSLRYGKWYFWLSVDRLECEKWPLERVTVCHPVKLEYLGARRDQMNESSIQGVCFCGTVTFEVDPPFKKMIHCHCSRCRKGTGHATNLTVEPGQFRWRSGEAVITR